MNIYEIYIHNIYIHMNENIKAYFCIPKKCLKQRFKKQHKTNHRMSVL